MSDNESSVRDLHETLGIIAELEDENARLRKMLDWREWG